MPGRLNLILGPMWSGKTSAVRFLGSDVLEPITMPSIVSVFAASTVTAVPTTVTVAVVGGVAD